MKRERGQALVILAFALIALAAFAGLAIDGGRTYSARRQSQNTADAVAMAGTRLLGTFINQCDPVDPVNADNAIAAEMIKLARDNGIDPLAENAELQGWYVDASETRLGRVGWGAGIPNGATGIEAALVTTDTTTFLKVVGQEHVVGPGNAMAMTGPIRQFGGGLLPLGVPLEVIQALDPGETFYLMEKNNEWGGGVFCRDPNGVDCIGEEPSNANAHRGWLNLNYIYNTQHLAANDPLNRSFEQNVPNRGCGSDPNKSVDDGLQGWAGEDKNPKDGQADCPYPFPIFAGTPGFVDGDFIHGDPGSRESSLTDVKATYGGTIAYVPIFDVIYMSNYMADNFTAPQNPVPDGSLSGSHWPRAGGGGHAFLYHIVGFAAVLLDGSSPHHTLSGEFQSAIVGDSQITPGQGFNGSGGGSGGSGACNPFAITGVQLWQ